VCNIKKWLRHFLISKAGLSPATLACLKGRAPLKRCYSLKKNRDFQFTYRTGKSVGGRSCTLVYVHDHRRPRKPKNGSLAPAVNVRVGFSVSRKVGNSVMRNRAKRRLREALSPYLVRIRPGHNLIVIAKPQVLEEPFPSLRAQLASMLKKAGLLLPAPEGSEESGPDREAAAT